MSPIIPPYDYRLDTILARLSIYFYHLDAHLSRPSSNFSFFFFFPIPRPFPRNCRDIVMQTRECNSLIRNFRVLHSLIDNTGSFVNENALGRKTSFLPKFLKLQESPSQRFPVACAKTKISPIPISNYPPFWFNVFI